MRFLMRVGCLRTFLRCSVVSLLLLTGGCSLLTMDKGLFDDIELKPWVKPYERAHLSRAEMLRIKHEFPRQFREHIYAVRGAAKGATGSQGGGCGCN